MFNVTFEIDGRKVNPNDMGSALEQAVLKRVQEKLTERLRGIGPTLHGERLSVSFKGRSLDHLSMVLSGPEELIAEAKKRLN